MSDAFELAVRERLATRVRTVPGQTDALLERVVGALPERRRGIGRPVRQPGLRASPVAAVAAIAVAVVLGGGALLSRMGGVDQGGPASGSRTPIQAPAGGFFATVTSPAWNQGGMQALLEGTLHDDGTCLRVGDHAVTWPSGFGWFSTPDGPVFGSPDGQLSVPDGGWVAFGGGYIGTSHLDLERPVPAACGDDEAFLMQEVVAVGSPSPSPAAPSRGVPPTMPPAGIALPYPDGCPTYRLSDRRCAYIVDWAREQTGLGPDDPATIELLGDPECINGSSDCVPPLRTQDFVVTVRVTPAGGVPADQSVFCGVGGSATYLCTESPRIAVHTPIGGYTDVPCSGEAPAGCATPVPTADPSAATGASPLEVSGLPIPMNDIGPYSVDVGTAVLPNGLLSETALTLADAAPTDFRLSPDGIRLVVESLDGGPPFDNAYDHGWRPGTERVSVRLVFELEWYEPGAELVVASLVVR